MAVSREPEFRTTRMREGYDLDAVDDFVDAVIDALDGRGSGQAVTPEQVENEEFKVVRMREGYVMDDVDDWLDAAAAELRRIRKGAQAPAQDQTQHAATSQPGAAGAASAAPAAPAAVQPPAAQPSAGQAPMAQAAPPATPPGAYPGVGPGGPPAGAAGYTNPAGPATSPGYPGNQQYYDTEHAAGQTNPYVTQHGTQPGAAYGGPQATSPGTGPGTMPGYDPLTDSAVNELDPVLRALDSSYGSGDQYQAPAHAPAEEPVVDEQSLSPSVTPSTGLHHVEIWVRDLEGATRSFGWLFERLGWTLFQAWEHGRSWQAPGGGPYVVVETSPDMSWTAYDRKAPGLNHLALAVPEQWMVDRIVSEAPAYGWYLMFAEHHPHAGGPQHYAAYMENDEGYEVEVVAP